MLALENVRQRALTSAQKRAKVTGGLRNYGGTDIKLVIQNAGPATATDVRFRVDGKPPAEHPTWLASVSDDVISILGSGVEHDAR